MSGSIRKSQLSVQLTDGRSLYTRRAEKPPQWLRPLSQEQFVASLIADDAFAIGRTPPPLTMPTETWLEARRYVWTPATRPTQERPKTPPPPVISKPKPAETTSRIQPSVQSPRQWTELLPGDWPADVMRAASQMPSYKRKIHLVWDQGRRYKIKAGQGKRRVFREHTT
ncbi:hypothetical protein ACLKA6_007243 [Drosophila palustris]